MTFCLIFAILIIPDFVKAENFVSSINLDEEYNKQLELSGAEKLKDHLPPEVLKIFENLDISEKKPFNFFLLSPQKIFVLIVEIFKEKLKIPLKTISFVFIILLLGALLGCFDISDEIEHVFGAVSVCFAAINIISPILNSISQVFTVFHCASGFILCFAPIITGISIVTGQRIMAVSYASCVIYTWQTLFKHAGQLLEPFLKMIIGVSIISSLTERLNLSKLFEFLLKLSRWLLIIIVSIFSFVVSLQNIFASTMQNAAGKGVKLAFSFLPIVGGTLGDAAAAVAACTSTLKSGVGIFGIISVVAIFLPSIFECFIWIISLNFCEFVGELFGYTKMISIFKISSKTLNLLLAFLIFSLVVFIVCTAVLLR
ncbi:MAG: stage III sporulation protein AE [Oscillospiraceae bacterium]|jgi:stage III sporulation protein AE|nr:stage III sporulation protein AE [Oscillospiraceae bacterium]